MANRAGFDYRSAKLAEDFGYNYALKLFGERINDLPRYVRGKNAGKLKGIICWTKCTRGGWVGKGADDDGAVGYVESRVGKVISAELREMVWSNGNIWAYDEPGMREGRLYAKWTLGEGACWRESAAA